MPYTEAMKARMIKRMTGPRAVTASALAEDLVAAHIGIPDAPSEADAEELTSTSASDEAVSVEQGPVEPATPAIAGDATKDAAAGPPASAPPGQAAGQPDAPSEPPALPKLPNRFVVDPWERAFLTEKLSPFFETPRLVKRFVNIYRLLRAGVPDGHLDDFRRDDRTGEHRVVQVLLAINIGFPALGARFLGTLAQWKVETLSGQSVNLDVGPRDGIARS